MDCARYPDDATPYICRQNYAEAIEFLEPTINNIVTSFKHNGLIANSGKSHFLISPYEKLSSKILDSTVESSLCEEHLGIRMDSELAFHKHIMSLCSEANQKLSALARIAKYFNIDKQKIPLNSFITAQFNCCPFSWVYHSRTLNNEINRTQVRALRIVYNECKIILQRISRAGLLLCNTRKKLTVPCD